MIRRILLSGAVFALAITAAAQTPAPGLTLEQVMSKYLQARGAGGPLKPGFGLSGAVQGRLLRVCGGAPSILTRSPRRLPLRSRNAESCSTPILPLSCTVRV